MPVLASITDSLVTFVTHVVRDIGLPGIFVLMVAESACIPIPSEATMLFAGFNVANHHYSLAAITIAGVAGNLVGSWIAYAIGYYGRIGLLERPASPVHVPAHQLERAERWFERWGTATVFFTRLLPIVRTFISLPVGVARMPLGRFSALTLAGCVPWVLLLGFIGEQVGSRWTHWRHALSYVDYVMAALIVAGIVYLIVRRVRSGRAAADVPSA